MPIRWVLSPVVQIHSVTVNPETFAPIEGVVHRPKVATLPDLGLPDLGLVDEDGTPLPTREYSHSSVLSVGKGWALSFVRYRDPAAMDLDAEVLNLFEADYEDPDRLLERSPAELGWQKRKSDRLASMLQNVGSQVAELTRDTPLFRWLQLAGVEHGDGWQGFSALHTYIAPFPGEPMLSPSMLSWAVFLAAHIAHFGFPPILGANPGIIFHDTFVGTAGQDLVVRTPDTVGDSWAETRSNTSLQEIDASGRCDATAVANSAHHVYRGRPNPTNDEYDVIGIPSAVDTAGDDPWFLVGRYTDVNNTYGYKMGNAQQRIYKKVASTVTELALASTTYAANDEFKLQVRDAAKKGFQNGTERVSTTDNAITDVGEAGFGLGNVFVATEDIETSWDTTEFKVDEVAAAAAQPLIPTPLLQAVKRAALH
jgi:hypothetical protein